MHLEIYQWANGQCGEFVGALDTSESQAVAFCYANWPEYQEKLAALNRREYDHPSMEVTGPPPFGILRPDGSWLPWDTETDEEEEAVASPVKLDESVSCQRCQSHRVASINGKTSDLCFFEIGDKEHDGYVPDDVGVGGGDYIELEYCLDCGQIKGNWPLPASAIEKGEDED